MRKFRLLKKARSFYSDNGSGSGKDYGEDTLTFGQEYDDDYFEGRDYEYESDT